MQFFVILALIILGLAAASLLPRWGWVFDLVSHFRTIWLFLLALVAGIAGILGIWWLIGGCLVLGATITSTLFRYRKVAKEEECEPSFDLILFNVRMRNRKFSTTLKYLESKDPDLIALIEVDKLWLNQLKAVSQNYPYRAEIPHPQSYGLALFSRYEIVSWQPARLPGSEVDHMEATLNIDGASVAVAISHLPPPFTPSEMKKRDRRLLQLGRIIAEVDKQGIIMGDFNASSWSPPLLRLEKEFGLVNARRTFGLQPTWPAQAPFGRIPIDHVLIAGGGMTICSIQAGPVLGSDHLPLEVSIRLTH